MSGFTKAETNAKTIGDVFAIGDVLFGSASFGAASTTDVITHGLSTTPDFVIATTAENTTAPSWTANTTSVTFTRAGTTTGAEAFSYIIGNLT